MAAAVLANTEQTDGSVAWRPQPGPQEALLSLPAAIDEVLFGGARGGGKCLPLDEPVLTPFGWKPIGELKQGSQVCNPDGSISRIISLYRPGKAMTYKLTFSDGAEITCDDGHIWIGHFVGNKIKRDIPYKLWRFEEIRRRYEENKDARFIIPLTAPVTFTRPHTTKHGHMLPVDPYALGVLLGDGCLTGDSIRYATTDDEIDARMAAFGDVRVDEGPNRRIVNCPDLRDGLKSLGLMGKVAPEKFVPDAYLWASVECREAVLQGLMDTDGTADSRGQCYFSSSSVQLAIDVQFIARSLGYKATLYSKKTTHLDSHQVYIRGPHRHRLFALTRKKDRARREYQQHHSCRRLVSIEPVGVQEVACFQVDNPNGLFIGRDFIVTHNTDGMLGEWGQHAARYGKDAIGIFFRKTTIQLDEAIERAKQIFVPLGAVYREQKRTLIMPGGARLKFRQLEKDADAEKYQGHSYTRVYLEELTNWATSTPINKLRATLRSAAGVPCKMMATANPGGPGHTWVKARYIDPNPAGYHPVTEEITVESLNAQTGVIEPVTVKTTRVFIPSKLSDNKMLMANDPFYVTRLHQSGSEALVRAWLQGDWDVVEGAFFDNWNAERHVIPPIEVPPHIETFLSFDWGSARPFSVGLWAVSDGTIKHPLLPYLIPRGALIRLNEWYGVKYDANGNFMPNVGLKMKAEDVGAGIYRRFGRQTCYAGDDVFIENGGPSLAERMWEGSGKTLNFEPADNKRIPGWDQVRSRLDGQVIDLPSGESAEVPMVYVTTRCQHLIRTLPSLQHDEKNPEDVNTDGEDHAPDEFRYGCMSRPFVRDAPKETKPINSIHEMTLNDLWDNMKPTAARNRRI